MSIPTILLFIGGIGILISGSSALVLGALRLAHRRNAGQHLLTAATMALGGALPELIINLLAARQGFSSMALGAVLGSNMANLFLIGGITAIIAPLAVGQGNALRNVPFLIAASVVLLFLSLDGPMGHGSANGLSRGDGLTLLTLFALFAYYQLAQPSPSAGEEAYVMQPQPGGTLKSFLLVGGGLAGIALGGLLGVTSGIRMAQSLGIAQSQLGLLFVALLTALPELTTAVVSARSGRPEAMVGGLIGSCVLNLLFVLGLTAAIAGVPLYGQAPTDIALVLGANVLLLLAIHRGRGQRIDRKEGILFVAIYVAFVLYVLLRSDASPRILF